MTTRRGFLAALLACAVPLPKPRSWWRVSYVKNLATGRYLGSFHCRAVWNSAGEVVRPYGATVRWAREVLSRGPEAWNLPIGPLRAIDKEA